MASTAHFAARRRAPGRRIAAPVVCALALLVSACGGDETIRAPQPADATVIGPTGGLGVVPPLPLDQRVEASNLIVTGRIESIDADLIRISVDEVLRGGAQSGDVIVASADLPNAVGLVKEGDDGVWLVDTTTDPPVLLGGGPFDATAEDVRAIIDKP